MKISIQRFFLFLSKKTVPVDIFSKRYPISIKGIIIYNNKVLLLQNERGEWDLPGGKIGNDGSAIDCLLREVKEETNLEVRVSRIVGTTIHNILNWIKVFIVIYECELLSPISNFKISGEHFGGDFFDLGEVEKLNMMEDYRDKVKEILKSKVL